MKSTPLYEAMDRACQRQLGLNLNDSLFLWPNETAQIVHCVLDAALPGRTTP